MATKYLTLAAGGLAYAVSYDEPDGLQVTGVSPDFTTITGSGFGSHTLDIEWIGADIEAGTPGSDFAKSGWNNAWGWANHTYATDQYHSGSQSLKVTVPSLNGVMSYDLPNPVLAGETLFMSWWTRYGGSDSGQWKMLRLSGNPIITDAAEELALFNWFSLQRLFEIDPATANQQTKYLNYLVSANASWYRVDLQVQASTTNASDGVVIKTSNLPGAPFRVESFTGLKTHVNVGDEYRYVIFQNYLGNGNPGADIWTDDVYIQKGTVARVEMGDNAVFSSCTHREIQVPTAWADGSITVTPNFGSFGSGASVYLFVIDGTGTASAGYGPLVTL